MWNLATGQEFLPDNWHSFALSADSYPAKMGIEWNSNVKTINGNLFSNSRIIGLSPYLFAPIAGTVESFYRAFAFNTGLRTVPSELFDGVKNIRDNGFQETFRDTYITGSTPKSDGMELWEKFPYAGLSCFRLCTMLDNYSQIPDYWK